MAFLKKRFYFSKKQLFLMFMLLLVFMLYYVVFHGINYTYSIQDVDLTRHENTGKAVKAHGKYMDLAQIKNKPAISVANSHRLTMLQPVTHVQSIATLKDIYTTARKKLTPPNDNDRDSIAKYIENTIEEALKEDKGTGCDIPKTDPFAKEVMQFDKKYDPITCSGKDWVRCHLSTCKVEPDVWKMVKDLECTYRDILYESDSKYTLGPSTVLKGNQDYVLNRSDHVEVSCTASMLKSPIFTTITPADSYASTTWGGHVIGFRPLKPKKPPPGRENTVDVLIFGFDSTAKNGFIRKMPKSYKFLEEELKAVILNGYNIVGDGTPASLFPILTGKNELELPECRKSIKNSGHLDSMPFVFYKLKEDGYRTAYFEDMPWIGTFQYRFNGFLHQPADHYLRDFYLEESKHNTKFKNSKSNNYCVGDTPQFKLMMNITDQFFQLDGKKYAFTFIADITHDDFNRISGADEPFVNFLRGLITQGRLKNTMILVMGDHGPRYSTTRDTFQGKIEERLPLMAIRLPDDLIKKRPEAQSALEANADTLTTPHDIYATVMDAMDLRQYWNPYKVKGADLPRGMTLLETVPKNRSCSEAGIEPHWCACLKWAAVEETDPMYKRTAQALLDHINSVTNFVRSKCAERTLKSINWVMKKLPNKDMLRFVGAKDNDGYVGKFGKALQVSKQIYQMKITVGPGLGIFEGAVTHLIKEDKIVVSTREISRTNAYNMEPACISASYPHLNPYCYCTTWEARSI